MNQILPRRPQGFSGGLTKCIDRAVVDVLSDADVYVCGQLVPSAMIDFEVEKADPFTDGPAQQGRVITLHWLKEELPLARARSEVIYGSERFYIKSGFPIDGRDCWLMAELSECKGR